MKARLGLILATAALFSGTGCAAGGGAVSQGPTAAPTLPASGGQLLAEGIRPRDNSQTRAAENFLDQGMSAVEDAEKAGFFRQALEAAQEGIAFDSENPKSYFQAAIAMVNLGEFLGADSMFTRAETLHPRYVLETEPWRERGWVDAYNAAIIPLNEGDLEAAAEFFEAANTLYSDRPEALLQLGSVYSRLGRGGESADAFRASMDLLEDSKELARWTLPWPRPGSNIGRSPPWAWGRLSNSRNNTRRRQISTGGSWRMTPTTRRSSGALPASLPSSVKPIRWMSSTSNSSPAPASRSSTTPTQGWASTASNSTTGQPKPSGPLRT